MLEHDEAGIYCTGFMEVVEDKLQNQVGPGFCPASLPLASLALEVSLCRVGALKTFC